jgi:hypothetical protein
MKYVKPLPYKQALQQSQMKTLLGTSLSSKELEEISGSILERARVSAKVRSVEHLDVIDTGINDLLAGATDLATQRLAVKQFVRGTGYMAPEEKRGGLEDFASDRRINLQLTAGVQEAQSYGHWQQGQQADILDAMPAQELVRDESRVNPRPWGKIWDEARAATVTDGATESSSGEMVALKNHPIWVAISRFKRPYPPFDYGSGMGVEDRDRADAVDLGLLDRDTRIFPQSRPFNQDLKLSPEIRSERMRALLEETGVGRYDAQGVFVYAAPKGDS